MDRFRLSGYSRLNFSSSKIKPEDDRIELNPSQKSQTFSRREPSPNAAFPGASELQDGGRRLNTHWDPFFLRAGVLIAFAIFFVAVIAALQVVYSVSQNNHGIATTQDDNHCKFSSKPSPG